MFKPSRTGIALFLAAILFIFTRCTKDENKIIQSSMDFNAFQVFPDSIKEGNSIVFSEDGEELVSNYSGQVKRWRPNLTTLERPILFSNRPIVDATYLLALETISSSVFNGYFHASAANDNLYTRDISYGIHLGSGLLFPRESWDSILNSTTHKMGESGYNNRYNGQGTRNGNIYFHWQEGDLKVIYQDISKDFGGWPFSTDAIAWVISVWEFHAIYGLTKGDLRWIYRVLVNSLKRAKKDTYEYLKSSSGLNQWVNFSKPFDEDDGLVRGIASYIDGKSGYPAELGDIENNRAAQCKFTSTNALYYRGYLVAAEIASFLDRPIIEIDEFREAAAKLKRAINKELWNEKKGYFAYYKDTDGTLSDRFDALGHAFVALWDIASQDRIDSFMKKLPMTQYGIQLLAPKYEQTLEIVDTPNKNRFNGKIWLFVQAYWAWIAGLNGRMDIFENGFANILRTAAFNLNFFEFVDPTTGQPGGSKRHFCAASGFLSIIYHGLFGLNFSPDGIVFSPIVPAFFDSLKIRYLPYRKAHFDLEIIGSGDKIEKFVVDGSVQEQPFLPSSIRNNHEIKIYMTTLKK